MPILEDITLWFANNWLMLLIFVGGAIGLIYFLRPKEEKYKQVQLAKEVKKDFDKRFDLTQETIGYGKNLYIGSRFCGFVLKSIFVNYFTMQSLDYELKNEIANLKEKKEEKKLKDDFVELEILDDKPKKRKSKEEKEPISNPPQIFYAFKTCGRTFMNRAMANVLNFGIKYFLVDKALITENDTSFVINPYCQPTNFLNIIVFSNVGLANVEEIAFKINHEQRLEDFVNFLPKLTFHELEQSKQKASYDMLEEINREKRKEQLEQIKKA